MAAKKVLTLHDVTERIGNYAKPNSKAARALLETLDADMHEGVDEALEALDTYDEMERSDFDNTEEYADAREEAWDEFTDLLDVIEQQEPDGEAEQQEVPEPVENTEQADESITEDLTSATPSAEQTKEVTVTDFVQGLPEMQNATDVASPVENEAAPRTILYTTAPDDYDGFGARTEQIVGDVGTNGSTRTYRKVSIPDEHVQWYRNRCGSGLHNNHTEHEWWEMLGQEYFFKKFRPVPGYALPPRPATPTPKTADGTLLACANCGAKEATLTKCRCSMCASWWEKNHAERRVGTPGQPLPPAKDSANVPQASVPPSAGTKKQEAAKREAPAPQTPPPPVASVFPLSDKLNYLKALITEGDDAVLAALKKTTITVKLPKAQATPRAPRPAGLPGGPKAKLSLEIARTVRQRLAEAKAAGIKGMENIIAGELHVHYTTIADVRDKKIWKEPTQA